MTTRAALALLLWLPSLVFADQIVDSFSSRTYLETAAPFAPTAVWNQTLGVIHPSLHVIGYGVASPVTFDIGDGSDGVFDSTTYAHFSQNGDVSGNKIRLDLSAHPTLQVTSFTLDAGWTLEPVGNAPLIIKSQSDVNIQGEIWCHGDDGSVSGSGGAGRCGGGSGGAGGAVAGSGSDGLPLSGSVTGGKGGNYPYAFVVSGGGGGGRNCSGDTSCTTVTAGNGSHFNASGGGFGDSTDDPTFSVTGGGAGGGGGAGTASDIGAGGGGGGGTVVIYSGRDFNLGTSPSSTTGFIRAYGGAGGSPSTTAGAGGGGGGGSVQIFVARTINIYNSNMKASSAEQGTGGTNSSSESGGDGGSGRSWITSVSYHGVGSYSPAEETPVNSGDFVEYDSSSEYVVSTVFDLDSSQSEIGGVTLSPSSTDFSVSYRGSSDNFQSDDTGWTTDVSAVQNKRYVRYRLSIATSSVTAPTMIDSATFTFTPGLKKDFAFKAAGCGRIGGDGGTPVGFGLCLALLVGGLLWIRSRSPRAERLR